MRTLRYDMKVMYSPGQATGLLALWGLVGLAYAGLVLKAPAGVRALGVLSMIETTLPLLALFAMGHAASLEWEERTLELSASYPTGAFGLLVRRVAVSAGLFAAVEATTLGVFWALIPEMGDPGPGNVFRVAWSVIPPALLVGAVGFLGSVAGKHYVAGLGAGLLVWGVNLLRPGLLTETLYLFQASRPLPGLDVGANRLWLTVAAAVVFGAAVALWSRRERSIR